jgi:hypothetical protein
MKIKWRRLKQNIMEEFALHPGRWRQGFRAEDLIACMERTYPERGPLARSSIMHCLANMGGILQRSNHARNPLYYLVSNAFDRVDISPHATDIVSVKTETVPDVTRFFEKPVKPLPSPDLIATYPDTPALLAIVGRDDSEVSVLVGDNEVILTFGKNKHFITLPQYNALRSVLALLK